MSLTNPVAALQRPCNHIYVKKEDHLRPLLGMKQFWEWNWTCHHDSHAWAFLFSVLCVQQKGFDVFNALDLMENKVFLEKLKFGIGDGNLQYYLYNWKCPPMDPDKVSSMVFKS